MHNRPRIVLLPGLDGTGKLFAPLVAVLGRDFECQVVSYPDSLTDYAAHEAFVRAALPTDREFVVLGESFSGPIAIRLGADPPPGLMGVVLSASFLRSPHAWLGIFRRALWMLPNRNPPMFIGAFFLLGPDATPELQAMHMDALAAASPATMLRRLEAIADVDVRPEARALSVPSIYLRASGDRLVQGENGDAFLRHVSGGRLVDLTGPHLLLQVNPNGAADAIKAFVKTLSLAGPHN